MGDRYQEKIGFNRKMLRVEQNELGVSGAVES